MPRSIPTTSYLCALTLTINSLTTATAEPLLIITQGASAQHTPTGAYLHAIDMTLDLATDGVLLSDQDWKSSLSFNHNYTRAAAIGLMQQASATPDTATGLPYPFILDLSPLRATIPPYSASEKVVANFWGRDPQRDQDLLCTVYQSPGANRLTYTVDEKPITLPLSGIPLFAVPTKNGTSAAIILRAENQAYYSVQLCELGGRRRIGKAIPLTTEHQHFGIRAHAALISQNSQYLYVAFSDYLLGDPDGKRDSWIEAIDLNTSTRIPQPIKIQGTLINSNTALIPGTDESCWILSHTTGRSHAFATNITADNNTLRTLATHTYSGVNTPLQVAVNPHSRHTAIAIGQKIQLYDQNHAPYKTLPFPQTITALYWSNNGLMVGLANSLLQVNPDSGATQDTLSIPSGTIIHIQNHPRPDLFHQAPYALTSPRQIRSIVFTEDRIGTERFTIAPPHTTLKSPNGNTNSLPPWLRLRPSPKNDSGTTISINPTEFMRLSQPHTAHTTILPLKTTLPNAPAKNPATEILFHITVNPVKTSAPAILWVRNPEEYPLSILSENPQNPFAKIVTHLQAHPLSYTLQEIAKPVNIDINSFTTIVLTSASAEYGIFTRQALLDYLSRGGTILYLANSPSRPNNDSVGRWLEALGMQLDTTSPLNGIYTANTKEAFMRHWKNVQIRNGTPIKVTDRNSILAAEKLDQNTAVAVTRTYGLGRVIAIASSTPFENNALKNPRSLRLAQSIFRHIADAANHRDDLDGDGIPDNIEDQNRNRRHDPGETHFALADTDGDGILDGIEDQNQNGFVDDIETDPLLSDTDNDGIPDAADSHPLPPTGTPYIASIDPPSMPAEGSRNILIQGRNFTPNSQIWFGNQISPNTRLLNRNQLYAIVPPKLPSDPNLTDIEVRDSDFDVPSTLKNAFTYQPRTSIKMVLKAINQIRVQYGVYQLFITATLQNSPVHIDQASLIIEARPPEAVEYLGIVPREAISNSRQKMQLLVLEKGRVRVTLDEPEHLKPGAPLFEIQCRVNMLTKPSSQFHLRIVEKQLRTPYQGSVDSLDKTEIHYDFKSTVQIPLFNQ